MATQKPWDLQRSYYFDRVALAAIGKISKLMIDTNNFIAFMKAQKEARTDQGLCVLIDEHGRSCVHRNVHNAVAAGIRSRIWLPNIRVTNLISLRQQ